MDSKLLHANLMPFHLSCKFDGSHCKEIVLHSAETHIATLSELECNVN